MIAPSSSPWTGVRPSIQAAARPATLAVTRTPTDASSNDGASTSRNVDSRVLSPPSNRMTDSAIMPTR